MRRIVALGVACLGAGCGGGAPDVRAPASDAVVEVVDSERAAARSVPVVGATPVEEKVARDALARLGPGRPITRVVFGGRVAVGDRLDPHRRVLSIWVRTGPRESPAERVRAFAAGWLAGLFGRDVAAALDERGVTIDFFETFGTEVGGSLDPVGGPMPSAGDLRRLGARLLARGAGAALDVVRVTGYRLHSGAVRVEVRLTARQALEGTNNRWRSTLLRGGDRRRYSVMLVVLAPDGTPLAYGGSFDRGNSWSGRSSSEEDVASPPLSDGPTRLALEIDRGLVLGRRLRYRLDCQGGSSRGIREPGALCALLEREWIVLLPPVAADTECLGHHETMRVEGTLGGVVVSREYSSCYIDTTRRWEKLLGVRP